MIKSGGDYRVSSFFHSCALCIAAKRISTMQHIFICTELGTTGHIGLVLSLYMKWGGVSVKYTPNDESGKYLVDEHEWSCFPLATFVRNVV